MQPTPPGWYWDPGNQPGLYRWWDGRSWRDALSANPRATSPVPSDLPSPDASGRMTSGGLSVPVLPEPWEPCPPYPEGIELVAGQAAVVGRTPRGPYLAAVFVGVLAQARVGETLDASGRGLAEHLLQTYYPHERAVGDLEPVTGQLAGRSSWQVVLRLDVDDPSLAFTTEQLVLALVERAGERPGVLFASLPDAEHVPPAEEVLGRVTAPDVEGPDRR